jgi:hypothetical protein
LAKVGRLEDSLSSNGNDMVLTRMVAPACSLTCIYPNVPNPSLLAVVRSLTKLHLVEVIKRRNSRRSFNSTDRRIFFCMPSVSIHYDLRGASSRFSQSSVRNFMPPRFCGKLDIDHAIQWHLLSRHHLAAYRNVAKRLPTSGTKDQFTSLPSTRLPLIRR